MDSPTILYFSTIKACPGKLHYFRRYKLLFLKNQHKSQSFLWKVFPVFLDHSHTFFPFSVVIKELKNEQSQKHFSLPLATIITKWFPSKMLHALFPRKVKHVFFRIITRLHIVKNLKCAEKISHKNKWNKIINAWSVTIQ